MLREKSKGGANLQFEVGVTRIFHCPVCDVDTPHTVKTKKGDMYGIICTNCLGGAIVSALDLRIYQLKWEEELQAILDSLVEHPVHDEE
mgnify:CR=1 FL=1|jgi:hypothetical protein